MRITFILPPVNMSGGIRVVAIYAQRLAAKGHKVVLVSPPPQSPSLRNRISSLLKGNGWIPTPSRFQRSHLDGLCLDHRVLNVYRPPNDSDVPEADVVIATWWETAEWSMNLSASKGVRVYFVQGHETFPYLPVDRVKSTYRLPMHKIVVANWLKKLMSSDYGDVVCDVVPNSVDKELFSAPWRTKQDAPTLGFLVSEMPLKGLDIALAVVEAVKIVVPALKVKCFGSHISQQTQQRLTACGYDFFSSPPQISIREIYASCDVWLSTSRSEGFNLTAIEAMACRTPVVSTRTGWPEEAITDGWNGYLADIDDTKCLAKRIVEIISLDGDEWSAMSQRAIQTVEDSSWEASSSQFLSALQHASERAIRGEVFGRSPSGR